MMRAGALGLILCVLSGAGCRQQETDFAGQIHVSRFAGALVVERAPGELVALSTRDGSELWRYQAAFPRADYLDHSTRYKLVCPLVETPDGHLLLRYDHQLHSISLRDGTLHWKFDSYLFASGRRRCVAATPDSGVVLLRRNGLAVEKREISSRRVWWYQLVGLGAAVNPPEVILPSGDTLLQTDSHVLSISPTGVLNWAVPQGKAPVR